METFALENLIKEIVDQARTERNKNNSESRTPINFVSVYAQTPFEFIKLLSAAHALGKLIKETPEGSLFSIPVIETACGPLRMIKICETTTTQLARGVVEWG
ncbi:MAG: hypothetical protein KAZ30_00345 [Candidatus Magasanikbacteria bacterium]|nr:hypothetical protein [Candidatus Magasanikbacteria bacterium]